MSSVGVESSYLTKSTEIAKKAKLLSVKGITAASYCPLDGYVDTSRIMKFYFREAKKRGVTILGNTKVVCVLKENGAVVGVKTDKGETIYTNTLVDCAGSYSNDLGKLAGVNIPIKASKRDLTVIRPLRFINYTFPNFRGC